jgi:hypothetical protein
MRSTPPTPGRARPVDERQDLGRAQVRIFYGPKKVAANNRPNPIVKQ